MNFSQQIGAGFFLLSSSFFTKKTGRYIVVVILQLLKESWEGILIFEATNFFKDLKV